MISFISINLMLSLVCLTSLRFQKPFIQRCPSASFGSAIIVRSTRSNTIQPSNNNNNNRNNKEQPEISQQVNTFNPGKPINVTVTQFGPLGASVTINDYATTGLILQKEIARFREKRDGEDVVIGETLVGYVERVREDGKIDVSLRPGVATRISDVKKIIMDALLGSPSGTILIGDKSSAEDVGSYFHGVSKTDFKNAIGSLYKEQLVIPGKLETSLAPNADEIMKQIEEKEIQLQLASSSSSATPNGKRIALSSSSSTSTSRFITKENRNNKNTIFIGNLPPNTKSADVQIFLEGLLGPTVKQVRLSLDADGNSKGFGFVDMYADENNSNPGDNNYLQEVVAKIKNQNYRGRTLRCDIDVKK